VARPILEIANLNVSFRLFEGTARVLTGISFSIMPGERVAIVGESGCGKSLTARAIMGLTDPRHAEVKGKIVFDGVDLATMSHTRLRKVRGREMSMIFQDATAALNPMFRIGSQMAEIILATGVTTSRREAIKLAIDRLREVTIQDPMRVLRAYPFELSGGMAQRVMIVMGTISRPRLIIADEPGASLDVTVQNRTLMLLDQLGAETGAAILMITHNLGVVRKFAQRVVVMYAGAVVEMGTTDAVLSSPVHPYTRALLAAVPRLSGKRLPVPIEGVVPSYLRPPRGCRFATRCPYVLDRCQTMPPTLQPFAAPHTAACFRTGELPQGRIDADD
jgi:oligopeptide/dipeptide ABC transporter ATP-binding protein